MLARAFVSPTTSPLLECTMRTSRSSRRIAPVFTLFGGFYLLRVRIGGAVLACAAAVASAGPPPAPAGRELIVTSLADYSPAEQEIPGTLRHALRIAAGPTTIRFGVSGFINLRNKLTIDKPNITIDGSQAPGEGIALQRQQVEIVNTHDVTLRHLRIRSGDGFPDDRQRRRIHGEYDKDFSAGGSGGWRSLLIAGTTEKKKTTEGTENTEMKQVEGGPKKKDSPPSVSPVVSTRDILIEHCSIQDSTDDNANVWGDCRAITFRYCIFSGGIQKASKGLLAGAPNTDRPPDYPDWITIDHCLFAEVAIRAPDLAGGVAQVVNCVRIAPHQGARFTNAKANVVGNVFVSQKNHPWGKNADRVLTCLRGQFLVGGLYVSDNMLDGRPISNRSLFGFGNEAQTDLPASAFRATPWPGLGKPQPASVALRDVLKNAGCTKPSRDAQDRRVIENAARAAGVSPR